MEKDYSKLIQNLSKIPAKGDFKNSIFLAVEKLEKNRAKTRAYIFGFGTLSSLCATIFLGIHVTNAFTQSGLYQYISLIFSSGSSIFLYWKELVLSIVDAMPFAAVVAFLTTIGISIWSGSKTVQGLEDIKLTA